MCVCVCFRESDTSSFSDLGREGERKNRRGDERRVEEVEDKEGLRSRLTEKKENVVS